MEPREAKASPEPLPDWEAFYSHYRKPGYVPGFELTHKLGGGAFGLVYRAQKQSIGKDYAIKFLKVEDGEVRAAVLSELDQVRYFAQIDHPNLVAIEDRGEVDGIPYLVMGYAGSGTLADRLPAKDAADRRELLGLFLQACRGVSALHERSLVHFDLKPGNVFLKGSVARVGDYGLSRLLTHSRASLTMGRGTPYYMAPELLQRQGDWRSDIYSLGVMLFEILCGQVPFTGESEWEVLKKHEKEAPRYPAELDPQHRRVLERCLQKDPAQRFQSVADLMTALGAPVSTAAAAVQEVVRPASAFAPVGAAAGSAASASYQASAAVPPPLPTRARASLTEPPPLPDRAFQSRRPVRSVRRRGGLGVLVVLVGLFAVFLFYARGVSSKADMRAGAQWARDQAKAAVGEVRTQVSRVVGGASAPATPEGELSSNEQIRSFAKDASQAIADATKKRSRDVTLKQLDWAIAEVGAEIEQCTLLLEGLMADAPYSAAHGMKLELYGYPMFLAAVERLQNFDFNQPEECRRGGVLAAFLEQQTGFGEAPIVCLKSPGDTTTARRNRVAADQWRRFAEKFCHDQNAWREALSATGKTPSRGRSR